jgi:hypothetical protein
MELSVLLAALRTPTPDLAVAASSSLLAAITAFTVASERKARADAEAAIARRPSTFKASLKSTMALERARRHLTAELRLVGLLTDDADPTLRLSS